MPVLEVMTVDSVSASGATEEATTIATVGTTAEVMAIPGTEVTIPIPAATIPTIAPATTATIRVVQATAGVIVREVTVVQRIGLATDPTDRRTIVTVADTDLTSADFLSL